MNTPKDIVGLMEAYTAVYDDELRDELDYENELMEDDLSFLDDLSDNELVQVMEEILAEGEYTLDECLNIFEGEILSESSSSDYMQMMHRAQSKKRAGERSAAATATRMKSAERERVGRKHAIKRLQVAATRAGQKAKTLGGGAVSAVAGGAADIKRGAQRKAQAAGEKIQRAKEKVKGFLGKVGRAAKAGVSAARKEFSGQAEREARARTTGRQMRRAARRQAARDTSEFERKPYKAQDPWKGSETTAKVRPIVTTTTTKALTGSSPRAALPAGRGESPRRAAARMQLATRAAGERTSGIRFAGPGGRVAGERVLTTKTASSKPASRTREASKFAKSAGISEEILNYILEDLIQEGYAYDMNEALEILEDLTETEFDTLVESYLDEEEVETLDFYDDVLDYLVSEGFAETEEDATAIMANMSEDWRDEILTDLSEAKYDPMTGKEIGHPDPNSPEEVAKKERRQKRGKLQFDDRSDPRRTGGKNRR